jgi:hypothetical protein
MLVVLAIGRMFVECSQIVGDDDRAGVFLAGSASSSLN